jgi:cytochrome c biogenesis protein CcdA
MKARALLLILALALAATAVIGQELPANVLRAQQETLFEAHRITFLVAFLAGFLSFVSPCTWPALAPFFAFGFKEKRRITRMSLLFFAGYAPVFILLGLLASAFGGFFAAFRNELALIAGMLLVLLGIYTFLGKGFSVVRINRKFGHDAAGILLMGGAFAVGFTPCVGPILTGVLLIAATLAKLKAGLLMLAYSLGIFAPLFLLAMAWDRMGWFRGIAAKEVMLLGKPRSLAHVIAGSLLVLMGGTFIGLRNTAFANAWEVASLKAWWFSVQDYLIGSPWAAIAGAAILALVVLAVLSHLRAEERGKDGMA